MPRLLPAPSREPCGPQRIQRPGRDRPPRPCRNRPRAPPQNRRARTFTISGLDAGKYNLTISHAGFKTLEVHDLKLATGERLPVGELRMELGQVSETVSVVEPAAPSCRRKRRARRRHHQQPGGKPGHPRPQRAGPHGADPRRRHYQRAGGPFQHRQHVRSGRPRHHEQHLRGRRPRYRHGQRQSAQNHRQPGRRGGSEDADQQLPGRVRAHGRLQHPDGHQERRARVPRPGSYFKRHEQFNANNFFNNQQGIPEWRYRYNT